MPSTTTGNESKMPHPTLTKISGKPNRLSLQLIKTEVLANARSVHSDEGDGRLGHARLVLSHHDYIANSTNGIAFIPPRKPADVVHALNATHETMYRSDKTYDREHAVWTTYTDTGDILKRQLLEAVDDDYTKALKDTTWGYSNRTIVEILAHLDIYGEITAKDLLNNRKKLNTPWAPPTDIEELFANIQDCRTFADAGGDPISERNAVDAGIDCIKDTGLFPIALNDWDNKPQGEKTLANFTTFFRKAESKRQPTTTATEAGYHNANTASAVEAPATTTTEQTMLAMMAAMQGLLHQVASC